MRVLLVGATGVVGRQLVPLLLANEHEVVATATEESKTAALGSTGAHPVVLDLLDAEATRAAVQHSRPDAIVHQATALSALGNNPRKFATYFARTNRLRTEGTANLLAAAESIGGARLIAQSFCGWPFAPVGGPVKDETAPLNPAPPAALHGTLEAIRRLEQLVTESDNGVVLRYGLLYGPGTSLAADGPQITAIRKRRLPLVGNGDGVASYTHVADAATATVAALTHGDGVYNIVDDEPAAFREWLPHVADLLGAKRPRRIPVWLARIAAGQAAVYLLTQSRGGSNARAKNDLSWVPSFATWRDGFRAELAGSSR